MPSYRARRRALAALTILALATAGVARGAGDPAPAQADPGVDRQPFGTTTDGKPVERYTLTNAKGASITVITYGAILTRVRMPDRSGAMGDVLLGYDTVGQYQRDADPYFGALVGRVCNRVAKATFTVDGVTYHTPANNGPNTLHGGLVGYDKRVWTAEPTTAGGSRAVKLSLTDPDGDQGYPGTVHATVVYALTDDDVVRTTFEATTDKATPINLTVHGYWNLKDGGKSDVADQVLRWHADRYLPVDAVQIPTGELAPVAGTPFDFRRAKPIGRDLAERGPAAGKVRYDHTMVIDGPPGTLRPAVDAYDPTTGRTMSLYTDQPGVQFYTANFLDGSITGRDDAVYGRFHGFALEAQNFPDAVNHPSFPNCVLRPGQIYRQTTEYRFGSSDHQPE